MKKIVLLIIFVSFAFAIAAQERRNTKMPVLSQNNCGSIISADGWLLQSTGEWMKRANRIPQYLEQDELKHIDSAPFVTGLNNFTLYEFRDVIVGADSCKILIHKAKSGHWTYPELMRGWIADKSVFYYVFDKSEFTKLDSIENNKINYIPIKYKYHGLIENIADDSNYLRLISVDVNKISQEKDPFENINPKLKSVEYLVFHIAPYREKNIVQFQIYTHSKGPFSSYTIPSLCTNGLQGDELYGTPALFEHCYYETTVDNFSKFIKLNLSNQ